MAINLESAWIARSQYKANCKAVIELTGSCSHLVYWSVLSELCRIAMKNTDFPVLTGENVALTIHELALQRGKLQL